MNYFTPQADVAGASLMAIGSSAPELCASIIGRLFVYISRVNKNADCFCLYFGVLRPSRD